MLFFFRAAMAYIHRIHAAAAHRIAMHAAGGLNITAVHCNVAWNCRMRGFISPALAPGTKAKLCLQCSGQLVWNCHSALIKTAACPNRRAMIASGGCDASAVDGEAAALQRAAHTTAYAAAYARAAAMIILARVERMRLYIATLDGKASTCLTRPATYARTTSTACDSQRARRLTVHLPQRVALLQFRAVFQRAVIRHAPLFGRDGFPYRRLVPHAVVYHKHRALAAANRGPLGVRWCHSKCICTSIRQREVHAGALFRQYLISALGRLAVRRAVDVGDDVKRDGRGDGDAVKRDARMHPCRHLKAVVILRGARYRHCALCFQNNKVGRRSHGCCRFGIGVPRSQYCCNTLHQFIIHALHKRLAIVRRDGEARGLCKAGTTLRRGRCRRLQGCLRLRVLFCTGLPFRIPGRLRALFRQRRFISRSFRLMRQCTVGRLFTSRAALALPLRLRCAFHA